MPRLGLCCLFHQQPIRFRTTTATAAVKLSPAERGAKLADLCRHNAQALLEALCYCADKGIGSFRINSQILPLRTHPAVGYRLQDLRDGDSLVAAFRACGQFARQNNVRTTFHPDQFVVLNSPRADVVASSLAELEYQAEVAEWVGADVLNIHGGGAYGDKPAALARLAIALERLPDAVRRHVTLENDDKLFTPADLLPICQGTGVPLVYDVHHHRCNPDSLTEQQATDLALATWNREPLFHISSPILGWKGAGPNRHHDFIDIRDFPRHWEELDITIEVEAKAKEVAVLRLAQALARRGKRPTGQRLAPRP